MIPTTSDELFFGPGGQPAVQVGVPKVFISRYGMSIFASFSPPLPLSSVPPAFLNPLHVYRHSLSPPSKPLSLPTHDYIFTLRRRKRLTTRTRSNGDRRHHPPHRERHLARPVGRRRGGQRDVHGDKGTSRRGSHGAGAEDLLDPCAQQRPERHCCILNVTASVSRHFEGSKRRSRAPWIGVGG